MRGYKEEGTTTTPFDMVMLNDLDRFHLAMDALDRVPGPRARAGCGRTRRRPAAARAGRASTGKTTRISAVGPGPTDGVASVLVVNAGSTSVKLRVVDENEEAREAASLADVPEDDLVAVAHRVVHGGPNLRQPLT